MRPRTSSEQLWLSGVRNLADPGCQQERIGPVLKLPSMRKTPEGIDAAELASDGTVDFEKDNMLAE
jgi:hypothetical protein